MMSSYDSKSDVPIPVERDDSVDIQILAAECSRYKKEYVMTTYDVIM